jgi:hypothetical protein
MWGRNEIGRGFWWDIVGKRPMGRRRCRWDDNIKMYIQEIGWMCVDCSHLAQDRDKWRGVLNTVVNFRVLQTAKISCGVGIVCVIVELGKICVTAH